MSRTSIAWAPAQEAAFFDAIAEGASIAAAARIVGKSLGSGASKFRRFALSLGVQAR
jgi:hypothetical protein